MKTADELFDGSNAHLLDDSAVNPLVIPAFERENRYLVLKRRDIRNSLTELEQQILREITTKVRLYREGTMQKLPLQCVVVEHDWPEYEPVWKAIEDRMKG